MKLTEYKKFKKKFIYWADFNIEKDLKLANSVAKINWYSEDKKLCGRKPNQPNFNLPKQLFNKTLFIPLLAALLQNFWLRFETTILFKMVEKSNNYAIVDDITPQSTWESSLKSLKASK